MVQSFFDGVVLCSCLERKVTLLEIHGSSFLASNRTCGVDQSFH